MAHTRTVKFELLRHGPPHNQLLSPLTQYLALCGNHPATTVNVPFEHNQLLIRLNAFMYADSEETRKLQIKDTARIMSGMLGDIPGLIAELAEVEGQGGKALTHLRLILSASELALLPFELADAPNGFPGAGQPLALQAQVPLCVTREVRRVSNNRFAWPVEPRILFLAAAPPGVDPIPLEAHLLALRKVIDPWVPIETAADRLGPPSLPASVSQDPATAGASGLRKLWERSLVVQTQASVASIRAACADGNFTHVHILAHGRRMDGEDKRYGLVLHSDRDPTQMDVVDGGRLATLLRSYRGNREGDDDDAMLAGPAVVTLATCNSGALDAIGSVVGAGASIAHALHEGRVPLVVGAQFPLSFAASVVMAEVLYNGLLWGGDPRPLLNDLRSRLKSLVPETHDWAGLVAYASLPVDIEDQLFDVRFRQSERCINTALRTIDRVTRQMKFKKSTPTTPPASGDTAMPPGSHAMARARDKLRDATRRLERLLPEAADVAPRKRSLIYGLRASTEKRDAELFYLASLAENRGDVRPGDVDFSDHPGEWEAALDRAQRFYDDAFRTDRSSSWALVQRICTAAVRRGPDAITVPDWLTAHTLAKADCASGDKLNTIWAEASLVELYLLKQLVAGWPGMSKEAFDKDKAKARDKALDHAERLVELAGRDSVHVYSTRRQIDRYTNFFQEIQPAFEPLVPMALEVLGRLPHNRKYE